jgi:hypothetical protein
MILFCKILDLRGDISSGLLVCIGVADQKLPVLQKNLQFLSTLKMEEHVPSKYQKLLPFLNYITPNVDAVGVIYIYWCSACKVFK